MKQYSVWDRVSPINGVQAEHFLNQLPFKTYNGDIILIYADDGKTVTNVECKNILAQVFNIDSTLPIGAFMTEYFSKTAATA